MFPIITGASHTLPSPFAHWSHGQASSPFLRCQGKRRLYKYEGVEENDLVMGQSGLRIGPIRASAIEAHDPRAHPMTAMETAAGG